VKDFEPLRQPKKDKIELTAEQKKHIELLGSLQLRKGQKLWKVHHQTKEVSEATFHHQGAVSLFEKQYHRKVLVEEGYWYTSAINKKNALRKFEKMMRAHIIKQMMSGK
jgi:hypothetical protein